MQVKDPAMLSFPIPIYEAETSESNESMEDLAVKPNEFDQLEQNYAKLYHRRAKLVASIRSDKILFERGEFFSIDSHNTSKALLAYSSGLIFIGGVRLYTQVFFANKNTKTPFKLSIYNLFWNIIFCYLFAFKLDLGFVGLALASSASSLVLFFSLFYSY